MKHSNPSLLYFSFDEARRTSFWDIVFKEEICYQESAMFQCLKDALLYQNIANLTMFLSNYKEDYRSLHVIVDIASFDNDTRKEQIKLLRDIIVSYPEVQFLFDKHHANDSILLNYLFFDEEKVKKDYEDFPDTDWRNVKNKIFCNFLEICWDKPMELVFLQELFYRIICGMDNTFDATNLRYAIKYWKYITLKVDTHRNFSLIQDHRSNNLAICVEEEASQNMFVSYALYKNGYRVLPITSAIELKTINKDIQNIPNEKVLIFRDYDLQFEDEGKAVNLVRGYKHCTKEERDENLKYLGDENNYYTEGWTDLRKKDQIDEKENLYWGNLVEYETYFISKGPKCSKIIPPTGKNQSYFSTDKNLFYLVGFAKPVSGIYYHFHKIDAIRDSFKQTRQREPFITDRNKHDHGTPLDIYYIINFMLRRAEHYYKEEKYKFAALLASEAIEIMNGFHQRLMVKAYNISSKAENAIAMDIVGGDEEALASDSIFRINMIQEDIQRIYLNNDNHIQKDWTTQDKQNDLRSINVLNRIYNDCRKYCKETEHYKAEDCFISAMAHINEGVSLKRLLHNIQNEITKITNKIKAQ